MTGPTKGSVAGQPIKTDVVSKEYEDGHARVFGEARPDFPRGRRFRWDPHTKSLVQVGTVEEPKAINAPIVTDRFYENTASPIDGRDIGSRRRHREYMKEKGLAIADDYKGQWSKQAQEREAIRNAEHDRHERKEEVARAMYHHHKP